MHNQPDYAKSVAAMSKVRSEVWRQAQNLARYIIDTGNPDIQLRPFEHIPNGDASIIYVASLKDGQQPVLTRCYDGTGYGEYSRPGTESSYDFEPFMPEKRIHEFLVHCGWGLFQAMEEAIGIEAARSLDTLAVPYSQALAQWREWQRLHPTESKKQS